MEVIEYQKSTHLRSPWPFRIQSHRRAMERPIQTELGCVKLLMNARRKSILPASTNKQVSENAVESRTHRPCCMCGGHVQGSPRKCTFPLISGHRKDKWEPHKVRRVTVFHRTWKASLQEIFFCWGSCCIVLFFLKHLGRHV